MGRFERAFDGPFSKGNRYNFVLNSNDSEDECVQLENACAVSKKDSCNGMRIYSTVADEHKKTLFKININGNNKYIHKQTAPWYLTKTNHRLSSDRLVRVQKMNKQK